MSKYASGRIGGPLSIGLPDPLNILPSISTDTGVFNTCRKNIKINIKTNVKVMKENKNKKIVGTLFLMSNDRNMILHVEASNMDGSINKIDRKRHENFLVSVSKIFLPLRWEDAFGRIIRSTIILFQDQNALPVNSF